MLIRVFICNFSKYLKVGTNFIPKSVFFHISSIFRIEIWQIYISQNKPEETSQGWENVLVNNHVFYRYYHFSFAHKQVFIFFCICICVYICVHSHNQTPCTVHYKLLNTILWEYNVFDKDVKTKLQEVGKQNFYRVLKGLVIQN